MGYATHIIFPESGRGHCLIIEQTIYWERTPRKYDWSVARSAVYYRVISSRYFVRASRNTKKRSTTYQICCVYGRIHLVLFSERVQKWFIPSREAAVLHATLL